MTLNTGDLHKGVTIEIDGVLFQLLDVHHIKAKRSAQVRMKLRDVKNGHTVEKTVFSGEKFVKADVETREVQYLYNDEDLYYFMDTQSFDQFPLNKENIENVIPFITDNMLLELAFYENDPIGAQMPTTVVLKVDDTPPSHKGDTATSGTKPATLETGLVITVPSFIQKDSQVVVDTRTGEYVERA
jgi:elongation factor P|tara:strand:- start:2366 stop:2923 length:558 start_codon:yes stop_codon:yes gene_type:complete